MWLNLFTVALVEKNVEKISELVKDTPAFENLEDMQEALYLIKEADTLMQDLQDENRQIKAKLAKHIEFINSTQTRQPPNLDTSH